MKNIKLFENYISSDNLDLEGINEEEALFASELVKSLTKGVLKPVVEGGAFEKTWVKWVKYQSEMADLVMSEDLKEDKFKNKILEITNWLKSDGNSRTIRILYGMKEKFQEEKSRFPMTATMYDIIDKVKI